MKRIEFYSIYRWKGKIEIVYLQIPWFSTLKIPRNQENTPRTNNK